MSAATDTAEVALALSDSIRGLISDDPLMGGELEYARLTPEQRIMKGFKQYLDAVMAFEAQFFEDNGEFTEDPYLMQPYLRKHLVDRRYLAPGDLTLNVQRGGLRSDCWNTCWTYETLTAELHTQVSLEASGLGCRASATGYTDFSPRLVRTEDEVACYRE